MSRGEAVKLAVKGLLEVVESGAKNIELLIMQKGKSTFLDDTALAEVVSVLEKEREEELARKRRLQDDA